MATRRHLRTISRSLGKIVRWLAPTFPKDPERQRRPLRPFALVGKRSWIGYVIGCTRRYVLWTAFLTAVATGLVFAAEATSPGWADAFVHSQGWALFAIALWVLAWGNWADRRLFELPGRVQHAFAVQLPHSAIRYWRCRFYNIPRDALVGLLASGLSVWLLVAHSSLWRARFPTWNNHPHVAEVLISCWTGLGAVVLVTMIYGLWNYLAFCAFLLHLPLAKNLEVARGELQELTSFGLATGFGWSVALVLFADIVVRAGHAPAVTLTAILGMLAFALIAAPQFLAHQALIRARDERLVRADPHEVHAIAITRTWIQSPVDTLLFLAQIAAAGAAVIAAA